MRAGTNRRLTAGDDEVFVLMNVMGLRGNPYLDTWCRSAEQSGARLAPLSWQLAIGRGGRPPDWVHLQWPERALRSPRRRRAALGGVRLVAATALARLRHARVLITAHNVRSHEASHPWLEGLLWAALSLIATDLHVMTAAGAETFLHDHPGLRRTRRHIIPHGDYSASATPLDRRTARRIAGVPDGRVLITFGALRGYKGIDALLDAFEGTTTPGSTLIVAGRVLDPALRTRMDRLASTEAPLWMREDFLPDDELATLISAADWVVLPYRQVLNSGSLLLALTLHRPVLVPDTPTFREVGARVGSGWVRYYDGELSAEALDALGPAPSVAPDLEWCSWTRIIELQRVLWGSGAQIVPRH